MDLPAMVADIAGRVGALQDRARLQVEPAGPMPPVPLDPERIDRVLVNLFTYALKYSPPDTPVIVRVRRRRGEAVVAVTDRGVGIPPEDIPRLFERFFRARTGREAEGLGLGLYIARLILEAHGGHIWAESPVVHGSASSFALPLA